MNTIDKLRERFQISYEQGKLDQAVETLFLELQLRENELNDKRKSLKYISEIIEEKAANGEDLEIGSTAYKSIRRWASIL